MHSNGCLALVPKVVWSSAAIISYERWEYWFLIKECVSMTCMLSAQQKWHWIQIHIHIYSNKFNTYRVKWCSHKGLKWHSFIPIGGQSWISRHFQSPWTKLILTKPTQICHINLERFEMFEKSWEKLCRIQIVRLQIKAAIYFTNKYVWAWPFTVSVPAPYIYGTKTTSFLCLQMS